MNMLASKQSKPDSRRWAAVAEPQLCVMEALGAQLMRVNTLLETSFNELSTQFVQMADDIKAYRSLTAKDADEVAKALGERIERTLAQSIISMQFQDRVSQNLVITMDVLKALAQELEEQLSASEQTASIDEETARELYHFLRLGEIRAQFLEVMVRRGFIVNPEALGLTEANIPATGDDVELF